jgi:hypothetical protein
MAAIAIVAISLALGRVTFLVAVPVLWWIGYFYAMRSTYRDDIGVWVAALYPILAILSFLSIGFGSLDLFADYGPTLHWYDLPAICLAAFTSVVLAVSILAGIAAIPLLVHRELERWNRERIVFRSRLVALLIVAPLIWAGILFWILLHLG